MNILLILNAKTIGEDLQEHFGKITPLMLPLDKGCAIDHIYNKYKDQYDKIIVAVGDTKEDICRHIEQNHYRISTLEVDNVISIGYTVEFALNSILENDHVKKLTILFGDTELTDTNLAEYTRDTIFYSIVEESERWTVFEKNDDSIDIVDKKQSDNEEFNAFVGAFNFTNVSLLKELLNSCKRYIKDIDPFYETLKKYHKINKFEFKLALDWDDLGHIDRYLKVRKDTETRYFNSIEIDNKTGILTKRSSDISKFINEIQWYLKLPKQLEYLIPRIFDFDINYIQPFISMEYYSYPTLHDIFLYGNYNIAQWRKIFLVLFDTLNEFKKFTYTPSENNMKTILQDVYLNKTLNRLNELKKDNKFNDFFREEIIINNIKYNGLDYYMQKLPEILSTNKLYEIKQLNIIHGDYFFANILYEAKINTIRLIDPRGDFGGCGIYGDSRYELAKLAHSIDGKYDFIVKDLFDLELKENNIKFRIKSKSNTQKISTLFMESLSNYANVKEIKLIESLLFLSMVPLHKDHFNRQIVMLCTGIVKLQQIIDEV